MPASNFTYSLCLPLHHRRGARASCASRGAGAARDQLAAGWRRGRRL